MKRRLEGLALLVRCNDLVFAIPATQVERIVGIADLEIVAAEDVLQVRVLSEEDKLAGWDLGGLLGKPRRSRETWVICRAQVGDAERRFVLAADRCLAVVPVERSIALPASMFEGSRGIVTRVFACPGEAPIAFLLDVAQLVSRRELAAVSRGGVQW